MTSDLVQAVREIAGDPNDPLRPLLNKVPRLTGDLHPNGGAVLRLDVMVSDRVGYGSGIDACDGRLAKWYGVALKVSTVKALPKTIADLYDMLTTTTLEALP